MPEFKTIEIIGGLMNVSQVAEFLGVPKSTIYNLSMKGKIPHSHIGKLLRFTKKISTHGLKTARAMAKGLSFKTQGHEVWDVECYRRVDYMMGV